MNVEELSFTSLKRLFSSLPVPDLGGLAGDYRGTLIGPSWYRRAAPHALSVLRFGGWWGKRLGADGQCTNLFGEGQPPRYPMTASRTSSRVDGNRVVRLSYARETPFPWNLAVDELRAMDEDTLLGLMFIDSPVFRNFLSPFLLRRVL